MQVYRQQRNYENLNKRIFEGVGEYGIPVIKSTAYNSENWISFNYARGCEEPEKHGIHFFIDDYQFARVWTQPDTYIPLLQKFQVVCSPDFSPYADFPKAIQLYNHYRKHWLGAYWQEHGIKVIPTITWSDPSTFEWCFDGEPTGGVVALSSVGMFQRREYLDWLLIGYDAMLERLNSIKIIWKGRIPDELKKDRENGLIQQIPSFTDKWRDKEVD